MFLFCFVSSFVYAGVVIYKKEKDIIVKGNEQREQFVLPETFKNASRYNIIIPAKKKKVAEKKVEEVEKKLKEKPAVKEEDSKRVVASQGKETFKPDLPTLLLEANDLYHKKKYKRLLSILNRAEKFYPKNSHIKTMKGSLFYSLGWKDLATQNWKNSLDIEPNQPEVRMYMEKINASQRIPSSLPSSESSFDSSEAPFDSSEAPFDSSEIKESIEKLEKNIQEEEFSL